MATLAVSVAANLRVVQENRRVGVEAGRGRRLRELEHIERAFIYNLGLLLALFAGAATWRGTPDGAKWFVPSFVLLGALALNNSWGLVLRVEFSEAAP